MNNFREKKMIRNGDNFYYYNYYCKTIVQVKIVAQFKLRRREMF